MGCFKRAVYSNLNHKKRFLLIFMIVLVASVLLQLSYQIRESASGSVERIRKDIGASVYVRTQPKDEFSTPLSGWDQGAYFSYDAAKEIGSLPEVMKSNFLCMVNVFCDDISGIRLMSEEDARFYYPDAGNFMLVGVTDMRSFWNFKSGKDRLVDGKFVTSGGDGTEAALSERVMNFNVRKIGDMITVSSYFDSSVSAELKIVGIHSGDEMNLVPEFKCNANYIYAPLDVAVKFSKINGISQAEYVMNDPKEVETFVTKADSIAKSYGLELKFIENNLDFVIASTALNSLIKTCDAIFITVIALSAIILSLLVIYLMNDRLFETGVLLSLGESRHNISLQMVLEVLMPALVAINLGVLVSALAIPAIGNAVSAGMRIHQSLTSANIGALFLLANVCGILLVIVSSVIPAIAIRKYSPKRIMQSFR